MLKLVLEFCKGLGLEKVLLDCDETNLASEKTMIKCGGIFDRNQPIHHSNDESALKYFDKQFESGRLYLLDEPEIRKCKNLL